jgi:hypothetical protein
VGLKKCVIRKKPDFIVIPAQAGIQEEMARRWIEKENTRKYRRE